MHGYIIFKICSFHQVRLNNVTVVPATGWTVATLPLDPSHLDALAFIPSYTSPTPAFYKGTFDVPAIADTFIAMRGWGKGM